MTRQAPEMRAFIAPSFLMQLLLTFLVFGGASEVLAIDAFDRHTVDVLKPAIQNQEPVKSIDQKTAAKLKPLSKEMETVCLVVETSEGNLAKALVTWGFCKAGGPNQNLVPVVMLDRFATYERGKGDSTVANGKNVMLFPGFRFDFDLGQVVPKEFDADWEFQEKHGLTALGTAKLYAISGSQLSPDEAAANKTNPNPEVVTPDDFTGTWKVDGDGRFLGEWELAVNEDGQATGKFHSSESQASYPIVGQIAGLPHQIKLQIQFNNTTQTVDVFLFTKGKSHLAGTFTMANRKFGISATRQAPQP